jgi:hypothetical protein
MPPPRERQFVHYGKSKTRIAHDGDALLEAWIYPAMKDMSSDARPLSSRKSMYKDREGDVHVDYHIMSGGRGWGFTAQIGSAVLTSDGFPTFPQCFAAAAEALNGATSATTRILQGLCRALCSCQHATVLSGMITRGEVVDEMVRQRVFHGLYMSLLKDIRTRDAAVCAAVDVLLMMRNIECPPHGALFLNCNYKLSTDWGWDLRPLRSE